MPDMPLEVIPEILKRLPVKSLMRFRSVCKTWNSLICDPSFIPSHLQSSLSNNNTPFLLLSYWKNGKCNYSLHYDNDWLEEFKQLQFPPFDSICDFLVVGSCNGVICFHLYPYKDESRFVLWNPLIQKNISLPQLSFSEADDFNVGFGYDSRANDYKLLIVGVDKAYSWIQPYLFSLKGNCWKRVTAFSPNYAFVQEPLCFVNGAVHWSVYQKRNNGGYIYAILGFDLSVEEIFQISLPESLSALGPFGLLIMKYGESSIAVTTHCTDIEFHELCIMMEYGVVESWTKVFTLHTDPWYALFPRVLGFRKNGDVLLHVHSTKVTSLDLNSQQMGASLYLNRQQNGLHVVDIGVYLLCAQSYVESLVLLDKAAYVHRKSDVNHIDSSDSDESNGGESDLGLVSAFTCYFVSLLIFSLCGLDINQGLSL